MKLPGKAEAAGIIQASAGGGSDQAGFHSLSEGTRRLCPESEDGEAAGDSRREKSHTVIQVGGARADSGNVRALAEFGAVKRIPRPLVTTRRHEVSSVLSGVCQAQCKHLDFWGVGIEQRGAVRRPGSDKEPDTEQPCDNAVGVCRMKDE